MALRRPRRLDGFDYLGFHRYSLRFVTYARHPLFARSDLVAASREQIARTCNDEWFSDLAHCFMPDHVHFLVEGRSEASDLRRLASIAKQRTAYVLRRRFGVPLAWQEGYYERVLRSDEATEVVVRYIFNNPVRAGMVGRPEAYPFSGGLYWPLTD